MLYEKKDAWSVLLRLYHWAFALSIVCLVVTGLYVHEPWTSTQLEAVRTFPMAYMRYLHFLAGFVFTAALMVRFYLLIFGNRQEKFWNAAPITPSNIVNFFKTILFYLYIGKKDHRLGHNALAFTIYVVVFLLAVCQIITGFYLLYPESVFWQGWGLKLFGTQQQARFLHHIFMWCFMLFAMIHVYLVVWNENVAPEGMISSIFSGDKFVEKS